ncbi:SDR family oxidoreductase [Lentisphaera profundi]|uniref:SDR family oxidoreductase n=1 Tax=Lentisphaera profundi TaxID=1658616 RepID=A0ABY7VQR2_9BACT|nr:SDR family oxidoreductase [Lentisphaera profundi]WDE96181.1 SDR family oxidoreductase [Lentisphaera profundi]
MKERVLITGINGFLGKKLAETLSSEFEVYGVYFKSSASETNFKVGRCDIRKLAEVKFVLDKVKPQRVYHLAALSDPNVCDRDAKLSKEINYLASIQLAELCADRKIKLVFTSTDLVFDGVKGHYSEQEAVNPLSRYGEQKVMVEEFLKETPGALICRMPLMYSTDLSNKRSMLSYIKEKIDKGQKVTLFTDEYRSAVNIDCAAKALLLVADVNEKVLHLGGPKRQSRYEMGCQIVEYLGLAKQYIIPCLQKDVPMLAKRPADVSLDSSLAQSQDIVAKTLLKSLVK